ncbi:MAG: LacI family DNA-binding transcriptional regulator [Asticcacaulis sp.]|nr:LacI family DNA-binding transcriptional regulator [Asticcacaulis sp.]
MTGSAVKTRARASSTGRITLEDVAQKAGVSTITVSRAFKNPGKVAQDVRERIHRIASDMGYVSNRAASALASGRSMNIVVLVPSLRNMVFVETLDGIEKILRPKGYQLLLGVTHYSSEEEDALVRAYLAFDPDGILLTGLNYRESTRRLIERANIPTVHMMELSDQDGIFSVGFSQEAAAEAMISHLIASGRQRIGFIGSQLDSRTLARNRGYRDTLMRASLYQPHREVMVPDPSSTELGGVLLARLLRQAPDTDAVFFCNDDLAQGALFECLRRGIQVPSQLAIAGFNDLPASACTVPALTTVATPRLEVGVQAANMLLALLEGRKITVPHLDLGYTLRIRDSA